MPTPGLHRAAGHDHDHPLASPATRQPSLRVLHTMDEHRACVALERAVWGQEYEDIVPASLMLATAHVGALTIGAFDGERMVGFVYGLTGVRQGEVVHWSYMLGVEPGARDRGVGRRLKEFQRSELARRGIARMFWTFDPLQSRNAHLNLNRLGARVIEYVTDMYGSSSSPLHRAVGTDRLVVECGTLPGPVGNGADVPVDEALAVFTPFPRPGDEVASGTPHRAAIEVPWDLQAVAKESASGPAAWRMATREYFKWALGNQYTVRGLKRDLAGRRAFFVIERAAE